jgi:hypothetical protein
LDNVKHWKKLRLTWFWIAYVIWLFLRQEKEGPGIWVLCISGAILLIVQVRFELQQILLNEKAEEKLQARQQGTDHELPVGAPRDWREG